jgi:tight adherence protein C
MMQLQLTLSFLLATLAIFLLSTNSERNLTRRQLAKIPDLSKVNSRIEELHSRENSVPAITLRAETFRIIMWQKVLIAILASFSLLLLLFLDLGRALLLSFVIGISTFLFLDFALTRDVKKQRELIDLEFPAIMELLTLAIGAGQAPLSAVRYVTERSAGELHNQLLHVISEVRSGHSLQSALDRFGARTNSPLVRQFVDATVSALIRGTPLAEVLQRQVIEVRNLYHRHVLERAGKAEISMMVPIVFLILPVSILFALWPSLSHLNLIAG